MDPVWESILRKHYNDNSKRFQHTKPPAYKCKEFTPNHSPPIRKHLATISVEDDNFFILLNKIIESF